MGSFTIPVMIVLIATVVVLFVGIVSMARGGEFDRQHNVQLMFTRVGFQASAVILIIVVGPEYSVTAKCASINNVKDEVFVPNYQFAPHS